MLGPVFYGRPSAFGTKAPSIDLPYRYRQATVIVAGFQLKGCLLITGNTSIMKLTDAYRNMLSEIDALINANDMRFKPCQRKTIAATLFDIANEHGKGINTLFEQNLDASGFSLIRIQFETFIRACWLLSCAEESEVELFATKDKFQANDKRKLEFGTILEEVESRLEWGSTLSEIKQKSWKALNSYTHGGLHQAARRFDGVSIEQHHDQEQVNECIKFSTMLTFLSFCQIVQICETNKLDDEILQLNDSIKDWAF